MTEELDAIVRKASSTGPKLITGFRDGNAKILEPSEIYRIYAESGRVIAECEDGRYALRLKALRTRRNARKTLCAYIKLRYCEPEEGQRV